MPILCEKTFVLNLSDGATLCSDVINIIVTQFSFYANFILGAWTKNISDRDKNYI